MGVKIYNSGIWVEIGYNATKLATPVNINNVSFDGSSNITIYDDTKLPLSGGILTGDITTTKIINSTGIETNTALGSYIGSSIKPFDSIYGNELYLLSAASTNKIILSASDATPNIRPAVNNTGTIGTNLVVWNNIYSTEFTGSLTGNASTASKLYSPKKINGIDFDGSIDITINAVDSTERIASSLMGTANGVATLDEDGKLLQSQIPDLNDKYVFNQSTELTDWTIEHNLGKFPSGVTIVDSAGSVIEGAIQYLTNNSIKISFNYAFSGKAYIG